MFQNNIYIIERQVVGATKLLGIKSKRITDLQNQSALFRISLLMKNEKQRTKQMS